ncbi:hypothetical protein OG417_37160 [Actinoallomurus sp. NBC_01490]|uniref:hypothetical protein n=1 Tax=Actinoallomurus sp. NBC_01490 TaxID=2903557 RepID=UPI002E302433|nr:hypothetical protein [Actinoallomurus sp. NBC_01490]
MEKKLVTLVDLDQLLRDRLDRSLVDVVGDIDPNPDEALFWSGSWLDGFANSRSDIDLYLVTPSFRSSGGVPEVTGPGMPPMEMTVVPGPTRLDLTVVPLDLLRKVGSFLDGLDTDNDYPTAWSDNLREFVHRLTIGLSLVADSPFEEFQSLVDPEKFRGYLKRFYQNRADSLFEDVQGLLDEGDTVSAALVARDRMEAAFDMYLATIGETNTRVDKWRWKKIQRSFHPDDVVVEKFRACVAIDQSAGIDSRALTKACLALGDEMILRAI